MTDDNRPEWQVLTDVRRGLARLAAHNGCVADQVAASTLYLTGRNHALYEVRSALHQLVDAGQARYDEPYFRWSGPVDPEAVASMGGVTTDPTEWTYFVMYDNAGRAGNTQVGMNRRITTLRQVHDIETYLRGPGKMSAAVVTGWTLLATPDPAGVTITWHTDDIATLTVGTGDTASVIELNHDEIGTAGMETAIAVANAITSHHNIDWAVEGTPGV